MSPNEGNGVGGPKRLTTPLAENETRALRAGDEVLVTGTLVTARDAAHVYLVDREDSDGMPCDLAGGALYHCGPVIAGGEGAWQAVSAGPTTSMRMEPFEPPVLRRYRPALVIGKGGMGEETARALSETGAVYLAAPSGAGALLAARIKAVRGVWKLEEFGSPEALWLFEVEDFPALVAMDSAGGNLYREVEEVSAHVLRHLAP